MSDAAPRVVPRVVIVGAGHAGGTAAALLRQYGFEGAIAMGTWQELKKELTEPPPEPPQDFTVREFADIYLEEYCKVATQGRVSPPGCPSTDYQTRSVAVRSHVS